MLKNIYRRQKTLRSPISFSGLGVHTGLPVSMRFCPAPENSGRVFKRVDLPGAPLLKAAVNDVSETLRSTSLGVGDLKINTVEHVLAAVAALEIDNVLIELSSSEPPIADGSSLPFVRLIQEAGVVEQSLDQPVAKLTQPLHWSSGEVHLVALPYEGYRVSYTLHYPNSAALRSQFYSLAVTPDAFIHEIAPSRTFSLYEELSVLMDRSLIKGGSLDNAVVIKGDAIFSKEGLRFSDEMVRHKILDLIGDLALVGVPFHAHVIAIRSGHAANHQLAKLLYNTFQMEMSR